jgi:hypothetical protein
VPPPVPQPDISQILAAIQAITPAAPPSQAAQPRDLPARRSRGRKRSQQVQRAKERDRERERQREEEREREKERKREKERQQEKDLQQAKQDEDKTQSKKKRRTTRGRGRRTAEVMARLLDKLEEAEQDGDYSDDPSGASDGSSDLEFEEKPNVRIPPSKKRKASDVLQPTAKRRDQGVSPLRADPAPQASAESDEHVRLVCLFNAYDDHFFRNSIAEMVWVALRVHCPELMPWHAKSPKDPYPGDKPEYSQAREEALAQLDGCIVLPPAMLRPQTTVLCSEGQTDGGPRKAHTTKVNGSWLILLACGALSKEQWSEMIRAGKNEPGSDCEASHLCGNWMCSSPWHIIPETHQRNVNRKTCHKANRCKCRQSPRCLVGTDRGKHLNGTDQDALWQAALRHAQKSLFSCPLRTCTFSVPRDKDHLAEVGRLVGQHVFHRHQDYWAPARSPSPFVPDSQSPEPPKTRAAATAKAPFLKQTTVKTITRSSRSKKR